MTADTNPQQEKRTAVLFLHGIGQQQRYQTVTSLITGLQKYAPWEPNKDTPQIPTAIVPNSPSPVTARSLCHKETKQQVDFYEIYWAPLTTGQTTLPSILSWLFQVSYVPYSRWGTDKDFLNTQLQELQASGNLKEGITPEQLKQDSITPGGKIVFEVAFVAGSLLLALGLLALAAVMLFIWYSKINHTGSLWPPQREGIRDYALIGLVLITGYAFSWIGAFLYGRSNFKQANNAMAGSAARLRAFPPIFWLMAAIFCLGIVALFVMNLSDGERGLALAALVGSFISYRALSYFLSYWFVNFLGDVQVYITPDENSSRFRAREQILERGMSIARAVLKHNSADFVYDRVFIVGHSLGSVIGYDILRRLYQEQKENVIGETIPDTLTTTPDFEKIYAFVTFGSPLEKTRFFFDSKQDREFREKDTADRHQELATLFVNPLSKENTDNAKIQWTNFWYDHDIFANPLLPKYRNVTDVHLTDKFSLARIWVHSDYFDDINFQVRLSRILTQ